MIIQSDLHIHSENSYDASLTLEEISQSGKKYGLKKMGITDHVNFNDKSFIGDLKNSVNAVKEFQKTHPEIILGVELTPIEKPEFDYIEKTGTRDGYVPPVVDKPYPIELAQTKEQLVNYGIRYAIGASHWRVDIPYARTLPVDIDAGIREFYRQQMWLACDERVTILGHPWCFGKAEFYEDFSIIPHSMNMDIASALKENEKYVECNVGMLTASNKSEKYANQYAEFLRELFEMGIPVTYGSDSHKKYKDDILLAEKILSKVGFKEGDFSEIAEKDLW